MRSRMAQVEALTFEEQRERVQLNLKEQLLRQASTIHQQLLQVMAPRILSEGMPLPIGTTA
jgi:hypothetical protein